MMTKRLERSLALWKEKGKHVLMAMPYSDRLIEETQGCTLRDTDGNEVLDLASGQFCSTLGYRHPKYIARITEQMEKAAHLGTQFLSPVVLEAAAKLAEIAPGALTKSL